MDAEQAARAWIEVWTRAWPAADAEAIASVYTEDAVYSSHPFREPYRGTSGVLEYLAQAFSDEDLVECRFGEPVASGNRAAVEYWAILRSDGRELALAGTSVLRFAPDGRCEEHRDYWAMDEGRHGPPPGWIAAPPLQGHSSGDPQSPARTGPRRTRRQASMSRS